jgi:hypothetical protein
MRRRAEGNIRGIITDWDATGIISIIWVVINTIGTISERREEGILSLCILFVNHCRLVAY